MLDINEIQKISMDCSMTEFVGTTVLDTIGLVIPGVNDALLQQIISIELPRDTKGWGGHGNFIIIGGYSVSDVRRAVEIALEYTEKYAGELYISDAGHLEFTYSASASQAAVKNAVLTAREVGLQLLISMGSYPEVPGTPYL